MPISAVSVCLSWISPTIIFRRMKSHFDNFTFISTQLERRRRRRCFVSFFSEMDRSLRRLARRYSPLVGERCMQVLRRVEQLVFVELLDWRKVRDVLHFHSVGRWNLSRVVRKPKSVAVVNHGLNWNYYENIVEYWGKMKITDKKIYEKNGKFKDIRGACDILR